MQYLNNIYFRGGQYVTKSSVAIKNKRTNGPVNAHLRSAVYTNVIENSPSIGADDALGPFFFLRIINILSIQVFPFK